jgi:hypothetical protein
MGDRQMLPVQTKATRKVLGIEVTVLGGTPNQLGEVVGGEVS